MNHYQWDYRFGRQRDYRDYRFACLERQPVETKAKEISYQEFANQNLIYRLTKALHDLQGKPLSESELGDKVKSIFNQCDLNKDGKISQDEFLKAGVAISEMFELEGDD